MPARVSACLLAFLLLAPFAMPQDEGSGDTLVVLPFENRSQAPGLEWIGEAFPEILSERLASPSLFAVPRSSREYAFERVGVPSSAKVSRATLYRIAEQMDVDQVVVGWFVYDGSIFAAHSQMLNMRTLRLSPEIVETGPLPKIIDVMTALAWDLERLSAPALTTSRNDFIASWPPIRLDAFENYVRGVTATSKQEKISRLREAVRLNPAYGQALLQLGKAQYESRDYANAAKTLGGVNRSDPAGLEANFYLGLASFYANDLDTAENAFSYVGSLLPLAEIINNRGVAVARRGKRSATDYFQRAVLSDPKDADLHFNLAVSLLRTGDSVTAAKHLKDALSLEASDQEAKSLLEIASAPSIPPDARLPLERIKTNYDEASFHQLEWQVRRANEDRLAHAAPEEHARFHCERGTQMLSQGFVLEAEKEFRDAIEHDPALPEGHTGLAQSLETRSASIPAASIVQAARDEARTSIRLKPNAEAYLVLARLDLRENQPENASESVAKALELDPKNASALAVQRMVITRMQPSH
jgi:Tfp pilus assembly protein PilF/TolB-like protein